MKYINKKLRIEKTYIEKIVKKFNTPAYVYSYNKIKQNILNFKKIKEYLGY